jgi:hypothetical protein
MTSTSTWSGRPAGTRASWRPRKRRPNSASGSEPELVPHRPLSAIWLRGVARVLELLTKVHLGGDLNYSDITPELAVGGAFRTHDIPRLQARGVTAVVDCRSEAEDDAAALERAGISFLHLPTPDHFALSDSQLYSGVDWVLGHLAEGGRAYLHCEHGVGRGPLMGCAVLIAQGLTASEALHLVKSRRWQAMPNDRQLAALVEFEQSWRKRVSARPVPPVPPSE